MTKILTDARIHRIELALKDLEHPNTHKAFPGAAISYAKEVIKSHREQARVIHALERDLGERKDWTHDDVWDAVERMRAAAESTEDQVTISPTDLRMLLSSADGVATSYSILLEHTTGLTKPTTDPNAACVLADDRETERFEEYLKDEMAEPLETIKKLTTALETIQQANHLNGGQYMCDWPACTEVAEAALGVKLDGTE